MDEFEFDYELVEEKSKESPIIEDNQVQESNEQEQQWVVLQRWLETRTKRS